MKSFGMFALVFAAAFLTALPAAAQQTGTGQKSCFQVEGTSDYYFGTIDGDKTVEHAFIFKNDCKEVIEIDQVRASCGCTAVVLSEKIIQPGGEAKIQVKFTPPKGTRGKSSKTVSVYLKGNAEPHTILRISADVKVELDIQPQYIHLLGAEVGKPITGKSKIKNMTAETLVIKEIPFSATSYADTSMVAGGSTTVAIPLSSATVTPTPFTLKPNEEKEISVTLTPVYKGQLNGSMRIKTEKSEAFLQVFGIVRGKDEGSSHPH